YQTEKPLRPESMRQVTMSLAAFDRFNGSPVGIGEISDSLLNRWIMAQLERLAPKTVARQRNDVLGVWRYAADEHNLCEPPRRIRKVKVPRRTPDAWPL